MHFLFAGVLVFLIGVKKWVTKQQVASKQQASKQPINQGASTREMGKNHSSIVVLLIRPKFWWMLPMGVRDNHTKYGPETEW